MPVPPPRRPGSPPERQGPSWRRDHVLGSAGRSGARADGRRHAWPGAGGAHEAGHLSVAELVSLHDVAPSILLDIRYFTRRKFVGRRIHGYRAPMAPHASAANGLARVQAADLATGHTLKVNDATDRSVPWTTSCAGRAA